MKNKRTLFVALLVLAVGTFWSLQVGAYGLFTADPPEAGRCSQCHTDWPGATHTVHQSFSCDNCHVGQDPVATSSCVVCHGPAIDMLNLHSPLEGPGDLAYCGYCHEGVAAESHSWGEMKALFE